MNRQEFDNLINKNEYSIVIEREYYGNDVFIHKVGFGKTYLLTITGDWKEYINHELESGMRHWYNYCSVPLTI